jgi:flagellar basal body P-ring formation protein FlgA
MLESPQRRASAREPSPARARSWQTSRRALLGAALALTPYAPALADQIQSLDAIRIAAESFVAAQVPEAQGDRTLETANLDSRLRLTPCGEDLRTFFAPGSHTGSRRTVGVGCPGPKPWTVYVSVRIIYRGEVLVAARALPRGTVLGTADLVMEERSLEEGPSGYITDPQVALGKRTTRPLLLGLPVTSPMLEQIRVVARGKRVSLVIESPYLSVRTAGTALEDGAPGDRIRVQNIESKKIVEGVVGDDGVVRVRP